RPGLRRHDRPGFHGRPPPHGRRGRPAPARAAAGPGRRLGPVAGARRGAGEVVPLAHAFAAFVGVGTVLAGDRVEDAAAALAARGVDPYEPGPKEGIA